MYAYWDVIGAACVVIAVTVWVVAVWAVVVPEEPNENAAVLVVLSEKPVDAVAVVPKEKPDDATGVVPNEKPVDTAGVVPKEKLVAGWVVPPREKPDAWVVPPKEKPVVAWVVLPKEKPVEVCVVAPKDKPVVAWVVLPKEKPVEAWVVAPKEKPVGAWVVAPKEKPVEVWVVPNEKFVEAWGGVAWEVGMVDKVKPEGAEVLTAVAAVLEGFVAKPKFGVVPREKEGVFIVPKLNAGFVVVAPKTGVPEGKEGETPNVGAVDGNENAGAKKIIKLKINIY